MGVILRLKETLHITWPYTAYTAVDNVVPYAVRDIEL